MRCPVVEGSQETAYDIFEPRPEAIAAATPATAGGPQEAAASRSLTEVKAMKGGRSEFSPCPRIQEYLLGD